MRQSLLGWMFVVSAVNAAETMIDPRPLPQAEIDDYQAWTRLLTEKKFAELEDIAAQFHANKAKYRDGHSCLDGFYSCLGSPSETDANDQVYTERLKLLDEWLKSRPDSIVARTALALGWFRYGYFARGPGYAKDVTDENAKLFLERSEKAAELLDEVAQRTKTPDLMYYVLRVDLSMGLGRLADRSFVYALLKQDPWAREATMAMAFCLMPRWYGSYEEVVEFAEEVADRTAAVTGQYHYTMVVRSVYRLEFLVTIEKYEFDWKRIQQGYRDLERQFPQSREHLDLQALLSIYADDFPAARELFERIGDQPNDLWGNKDQYNGWRERLNSEIYEGKQRKLIRAHFSAIMGMELMPKTDAIVSLDKDGILRFHDLNTGERRESMFLDGLISGNLAVSEDSLVAVMGRNRVSGLSIYDLQTHQSSITNPRPYECRVVSMSPNGTWLAAGSIKHAAILETKTAEIHHEVEIPKQNTLSDIAFSSDSRLAAFAYGSGVIQVIDVKTGTKKSEYRVNGILRKVTWSPKADRLAVIDSFGAVRVLAWPSHKELAKWKDDETPASDVSFSPNGTQLAIGLATNKFGIRVEDPLRVWNMKPKVSPQVLPGHQYSVRKVRYTPDGRSLVSASDDWTIRVWDPPKNAP